MISLKTTRSPISSASPIAPEDARDRKARWYGRMKSLGLRVKLAIDDHGVPIGMIQYLPVEHSPAIGTDLYMILCIWVHGHRRAWATGRAITRGKGIVAWGVVLPSWMKAGWFKEHGYRRVDRIGIRALMWRPFTADATPPALDLARPQVTQN